MKCVRPADWSRRVAVAYYRLLARKNEWMKMSTNCWKEPHIHKPWSLCKTSLPENWLEEQNSAHKLHRKFLGSTGDNFLAKVTEESIGKGTPMDFSHKQGKVHWGCKS